MRNHRNSTEMDSSIGSSFFSTMFWNQKKAICNSYSKPIKKNMKTFTTVLNVSQFCNHQSENPSLKSTFSPICNHISNSTQSNFEFSLSSTQQDPSFIQFAMFLVMMLLTLHFIFGCMTRIGRNCSTGGKIKHVRVRHVGAITPRDCSSVSQHRGFYTKPNGEIERVIDYARHSASIHVPSPLGDDYMESSPEWDMLCCVGGFVIWILCALGLSGRLDLCALVCGQTTTNG